MTSVPKPPAGLADRIKKEIPEDLGAAGTAMFARAETRRATWSIGIAASFLILISSVYVVLRFAPRSEVFPSSAPMRTAAAPAKPIAPPAGEPATTATAAVPEENSDRVPAQPAVESARVAEAAPREEARAATGLAPVQPSVPADDVRDGRDSAPAATTSVAEAMPAPASPAVATATPTAAPAAAPVMPPAAAKATTHVAASMMSREEARAAARKASAERAAAVDAVVGGALREGPNALANAPASAPMQQRAGGAGAVARFGISVDPAAVESVKDAIERAERPASVDVAALVNYFAGSPEESPEQIAVEIEGSPAPVSLTPLARVVRISIDTAATPAGVPSKPVAKNLRLSIDFNDDAVASHRLIGGKDVASGFEPALLDNTSVTALYDVQLRPDASNRRSVATVTLRYRDVTGRDRTIVRSVRVKDVARAWVDTSRRHRLACLVAIWGETLEHDTGGADVARRAEELARQEPRDSKARELARLATASSRLRTSGSTGSGR